MHRRQFVASLASLPIIAAPWYAVAAFITLGDVEIDVNVEPPEIDANISIEFPTLFKYFGYATALYELAAEVGQLSILKSALRRNTTDNVLIG